MFLHLEEIFEHKAQIRNLLCMLWDPLNCMIQRKEGKAAYNIMVEMFHLRVMFAPNAFNLSSICS